MITPVHNTTLPFTRMLAGPLDYTPGGFNNSNLANFIPRNEKPMVLGTRAAELALFVVFESPLEMVSDYPEQYKGQKDFDFLKQVPCTWDEIHVIDGLPMQFISVARRSGDDWYIGSITNWTERDTKLPLTFLAPANTQQRFMLTLRMPRPTQPTPQSASAPWIAALFSMFTWSPAAAMRFGFIQQSKVEATLIS